MSAEPRTAAGRDYLRNLSGGRASSDNGNASGTWIDAQLAAILAIEAESAALERDRMPLDDVDFRTLLHDSGMSWDDANFVVAAMGDDLVVRRVRSEPVR